MYQLSQDALAYIDSCAEELIALEKTLCQIPAPSRREQKRAEFCKEWLEKAGAKGVYIDEAWNVVFPVHAEGSQQLTLFTAHMDTVFPDMEPMPMEERDGRLYCPGAGDDTASVATLLLLARYLITRNIQPEKGFLLVCNSCEESEGNLAGIRQIMKDYAGRIQECYIFDGLYNQVVNWPLAVFKFKVTVKAEGGHAYLNFGNASAVACTAGMIHEIYQMKIPEGCKSSYNVGVWSGGEVPNGIAQHSEFLVEMRSQLNENLEILRQNFLQIVKKYQDQGRWEIQVEPIGSLPGKEGVDPVVQGRIDEKVREILEHYCEGKTIFRSGAGDINIPMSMGVPGISLCAYKVEGVHTREEYIELDTLQTALTVNMTVMLSCLE